MPNVNETTRQQVVLLAGREALHQVGYRIELMDNGDLLRRSKLYSGTATRTTSPAFIKRGL